MRELFAVGELSVAAASSAIPISAETAALILSTDQVVILIGVTLYTIIVRSVDLVLFTISDSLGSDTSSTDLISITWTVAS